MYSKLSEILPADQIRFDEQMKYHTSFQIGGPADVLVLPRSITDICRTITFCHENNLSFIFLGQGSNVLVRDKGIRGIVIKLGNGLNRLSIAGQEIYAEAGISLSTLAFEAAEHSLSGLEFAEGIPGSLGGAVVMNAGAYDGEMKDIIYEVLAIDTAGNYKTFTREQMEFGYRSSIFQEETYVVLAARLHLNRGDKKEILKTMRDFARRRSEKQPLEHPSAGSTFRRPEGFFVGPIIEGLGLKGFAIGGAQVSSKHAGFIVNKGDATAGDVIDLIAYIQKKVREKHGVDLWPEIKIVGEE
ncbi:udp-n-acetylenolpyruvoylglucosamine reductase [hydrocarbon metagenome]|uniref:UDP-N-acetylmuramate dehydrogenase n=1 Tax=hydrocarbon metagenome TaxID=938273 RepID=A0A0W8E6G1_9ZZZZ